MARREASSGTTPPRRWKLSASAVLGGVMLMAVCIGLNRLSGPESADAQSRDYAGPGSQVNRLRGTSSTTARSAPTSRTTTSPRQPGPQPMATGKTPTIQVVSVVNGEQITRNQLAYETRRRYGNEVLDRMVNKQLILSECNTRRIVITKEEIDAEIAGFAEKFGHTIPQWLELLQKDRDITPDRYRRDIIWPTLALRKLVAGQTEVTREEIDKTLESEIGPKVRVRMIAVKSREQAEQLRKEALKQAQTDPDSFGRLAKEYSQDEKSAAVRGLLPPVRRHLGDPTVEHTVFALAVNQISEVVEVAGQFLIFQCVKHFKPDHIEEPQRKDAEARIVEHLREKKTHAAAQELFKRLQKDVQIVNVFNNEKLSRQMPGVAATINGATISLRQLDEECISRHGQEVLLGEINRRLLAQELKLKNKQIKQDEIVYEVGRAAESFGYRKPDGSPDVDKWLEEIVNKDETSVQLYVADAVWPSVALKKLVGGSIEVSEVDVKKGYEANYGPRVEVLAIVLSSQRLAQQVWEKARQQESNEFFGELAFQYSIEPVSRNNYGRVPPIQKHGGRPRIEEEAFALQPGETSGLIVIGDKWIVLRCIGYTDPVVKELDDTIRQELHKDIFEKKLRLAMSKEFDRIKESAQIDNFLAGTTQSGKRTNTAQAPNSKFQQRVPFQQQPGARQGVRAIPASTRR
jgi:parvulin-like peptidyl-prolyl isomerase